mgnify:CR=1 FL=1
MAAYLACLWEVTARKPGNVTWERDFTDTDYTDFVLGALAVARAAEGASRWGIGRTVLEAVRCMRTWAKANTHLGTALLIAPLAAIGCESSTKSALPRLLDDLTVEDTRLVFVAIRMAMPGGLGHAPREDVFSEPTRPLKSVMALAAERDAVARQYVCDFADVFDSADYIECRVRDNWPLEWAIIGSYLRLLARQPDSLVARKCGAAMARRASDFAAQTLQAGWPDTAPGWRHYHDLDRWLRQDGNKRNPGTTADLVAASLFVLLKEDRIGWPPPLFWPQAAPTAD